MTTPAPTFPIPQFLRIEQNQTTDAVNQLIVDINAILLAYGVVPPSATAVTRRQYFGAVATLYNMNTLYVTGVPANANDPAWIEFWAQPFVTPKDALATVTQSSLALTDPQMTALFAYARTLAP